MPISEADKIILKTAQNQLRKAVENDSDNRARAKEDLEFIGIEGKQWPEQIMASRTAAGRPCLTINKMPVFIDQVVGDQRMNRPEIKVVPVDSKADVRTAQILGGWIKHVQQISKSDTAIDHGFEHAVASAYGAWRVVTKYISDDSFDQEAYIEKIDNALSVYWGKHIEYDCSDAPYCFLLSDMDRDEYKEKYNREPSAFNGVASQHVNGWATKDTVRVAEYFVKEPVNKTIYLLEDGRNVDKLEEGDVKIKERQSESYKIMWYLLSGDAILDRREWVGKKYIPIIPIWGKELNIDGKRVYRSLIRNAKDSQRAYNYWQSTDTETVTLQPKIPYMLTPKQITGHEAQWKKAYTENFPYLLINPDKDAPGWPHRETPPQVSTAMVEKLREADQEIRDTIGLQKASLGMVSNERSGAAIRERKKEGDVGTFAFIDNLSRSLEHTGRVLVDIAPGILDTERVIRLGLVDGNFSFDTVNIENPLGEVLNDLSVGTYDVVVTVGPSFTTQRTEAQISMQQFLQYYPDAAPVIGDLYAKAMDWPGAEEVSQRLELLLPPEVQAQIAAKKAKEAGTEDVPPSEVPAPSEGEGKAEAAVEEGEARDFEKQKAALEIQEAEIKLEQEQVKLEELKIKNDMLSKQSKEVLKSLVEEILAEGGD